MKTNSILGTVITGAVCTVGGAAIGSVIGAVKGFVTAPDKDNRSGHMLACATASARDWSTFGFGIFLGRELGFRRGMKAAAIPAPAAAPAQATA